MVWFILQSVVRGRDLEKNNINFFKMLIGFGHVYVWVFCLHVCICTTYMLNDPRDRNRVSDPLEVELQMDVNEPCGCDARSRSAPPLSPERSWF